jgi:uncharacterized protein
MDMRIESDGSEFGSQIKAFSAGEHMLVFLRDRMELRLLGEEDWNRFREPLWRGDIDVAVAPPSPPANAEFERLTSRPDEKDAASVTEAASQHDGRRPSLDRLTLTVSNVCNLGCSYCYAAKGTYYNKSGLIMTRETVLAALNQAARAYSRIEHINFFGGEPTLNCDVIEIACEYARYLYQRGSFSHMPTFGITTNGYVLTDRMLEVMVGYGFSVTLSLDGPREIHDAKRPTKSGRGSYEFVAATARTLLEKGIEVEFECTYSNEHLRNGMTMVDLMDFFHAEFDCRTLHCQIVSAPPDSPEFIPLEKCLRLQSEAIEASLANLANGKPKAISLAVRMLHSLTYRTPIWNYCPAGRKEVTVNADGDVYSCFMLMEHPDYSFGSVNPKPEVASGTRPTHGRQRHVIERLLEAQDKYTNPACQRCWAQPLCHGCLGEDFARTGGNIVRSELPGVSDFCDYKRGVIESFFRSVGRTYGAMPSMAPLSVGPSG